MRRYIAGAVLLATLGPRAAAAAPAAARTSPQASVEKPMSRAARPRPAGAGGTAAKTPSTAKTRPVAADAIAPRGANSAFLRRERAKAEGQAPALKPGTSQYNIATHQYRAGTGQSKDLAQVTPRPRGFESHHPEQQKALTPDAGRTKGIEGYNRNHAPTALLPKGAHVAINKLQVPQRQNGFKTGLGTSASVAQGANFMTKAGVPKKVAGQAALEHQQYLFGRTRPSEVGKILQGRAPAARTQSSSVSKTTTHTATAARSKPPATERARAGTSSARQ